MQTHCKRGHEFTEENTYVYAKTGARFCRECRKHQRGVRDPIKYRKWRKDWRKRNPHYHRDRERLKMCGATPEETAVMLKKQKHKCAICKKHMEKPQLDHDHVTGKPRELLCSRCNVGIGNLQDDPDLLESAASYIRKHKEPNAAQ